MDREDFSRAQARFAALAASEIESGGRVAGIGIYGEKRMHVVLKHFYCPDAARHEVRLGAEELCGTYAGLTDAATRQERNRYVADARLPDGGILEVQTGGFYPLVKKIHFYLCATDLPITVVHPILGCKWTRWMEPDTGMLSPRRRSPKRGRIADVAKELYWLAPFLAEPRLTVRVPLLEAEEIRLRDGWSKDGKRGSTRYERLPLALLDEGVFRTPADYAAVFLPAADALPAAFTAAEYAAAVGIRGRACYGTLHILTDLGLLQPSAPRGRAGTWSIV